jgi:hypothetical protein
MTKMQKEGSDFMIRDMEQYLEKLDIPIFQDEENRKEFVRLFVEKVRLEKELNKVTRKLNSFKNPCL